MASSTKRQRRKERNRANVKARTNAVRNDRIKRYAMFLLVAAAVIGVLYVAAIALPDLDAGTVATHGG
ncbi:hypothetical protein [Candidatus Lucifugimonas marina]|uniref:Uncharacterized protein n=1 Tax=Candidatus Lucifugimonas marina TaxID=3038979 RepID=A0AAJ5ZM02_9CHLR|nr:hypothetical protein [SAR202 cluster bacterium JH702]MDG0869319.1 hypothetical protein [SAR202 cluster bacterium JH639]WFG36719.1 hypothetical protein GKN94_13880 [SAR202 cluster bacterium JH545]WFG40653.1 hypothetical protein GKO48_13925 [SAR202 cluster bacterium JH1073]